ncbi:MAG: VWA domain-containing protein [Verrucomicrobiales bacterium]|nr:VWA domain-containing protein [Verrucomicrobiales bacterium]
MKTTLLSLLGGLAAAGLAAAQVPVPPPHVPPRPPHPPFPPPPPPHWIIPSTRPMLPNAVVRVAQVTAEVVINDQTATTSLEITVQNPGRVPQESVLLLPCPLNAVFKSYSYDGMPANAEGQAKILPKDEARRIYNAIVSQTRDPALLEFAGQGCLQSSVFPVPPGGQQKVRVAYEQLLAHDGGRLDYVLPRSEVIDFAVPWSISVKVKSPLGISSIYSPSHEITVERNGSQEATVKTAQKQAPGAFRLSVLREKPGEMTASLLAYPDPKVGGGYFLLMVAPPAPNKEAAAKIKRELTLVIDRSGSMAGAKLEQVKAAAIQVLEGLSDGEAFNVIVYNESVESFSPQPVVLAAENRKQARDYIAALRVSGGTNIHDAVVEALRQKPVDGMLPLVLFLTDGLPTIGQTSEKAIREAAAAGNPHKRRLFTFGVGVDVNTPLLSRLAREARGTSTFVLPQEDVEVKVGQVYRRLAGPLLAGPALRSIDAAGNAVPGRVTDLLPALLPDIFDGEQLILLGRYTGEQPVKFELTGDSAEGKRTFTFDFQLDKATTANGFVPRLWASNKIAVLSEAIRDLGADRPLIATNPPAPPDPKMKELIDEIIRLSTQFGILTEYTAFLATEQVPLAWSGPQRQRGPGAGIRDAAAAPAPQIQQRAGENYEKALESRAGLSGVNQELNFDKAKAAYANNGENWYFDGEMKKVKVASCQALGGRGFFQRQNRWVDGNVDETKAPDATVAVGTPEFDTLVDELCADNRQSVLALKGEILIAHRGKTVLLQGFAAQGN